MKIKRIEVKNFIGVKELNWSPNSNVNILKGKKGEGKTSILEAIEKAFTNLSRRSEVVRHGEEEATLYIETDSGIEIDRRVREGKSDYLKVKGEYTSSTEGFLRRFVNGNIFRPLDFVNMNIKEQTSIILNMIEINWDVEDIISWFGEEPCGINFDKHILQVLKDIEVKYYKEREEVNRDIEVLKVRCEDIKRGLPGNYDGEAWKEKNIQEYYSKIAEAQHINNLIDKAISLKEGLEDRISSIRSESEAQAARIELKYKEEGQDIRDLTELYAKKINEAQSVIDSSDDKLNLELQRLENEKKAKILEIEELYSAKSAYAHKSKEAETEEAINIIEINKSKIDINKAKIQGLQEKKEIELREVYGMAEEKIETEKAKVGKASEYIKNNAIVDVAPLQEEADNVAKMQSYLREWDRLMDIQNGQLREKQEISDSLTVKIKMARQKPSDLLKTHELPIDGISVDEKGSIRIDGTLLDGLSDGEKLEVAFKVALQRMGELRVMCLDGFEKLNPSEQDKILKICEDNDVQAFVTITDEEDLTITREDK